MRLRLKRKYLVLFTIILTIITGLTIQLVVVRCNQIKKEIETCDRENQKVCNLYEIRTYLNK